MYIKFLFWINWIYFAMTHMTSNIHYIYNYSDTIIVKNHYFVLGTTTT